MPHYDSTTDTRTGRPAIERCPRREGTAPFSATKGGVAIKWSVIGSAIILVAGLVVRYADTRWHASEVASAKSAETHRLLTDRVLVVEQQALADRQRADESRHYLQTQLAQIQAQLAEIQRDLRRRP